MTTQEPIRVVVSGTGKIGTLIMEAVQAQDDMELVGAFNGRSLADSVQIAGQDVPITRSFATLCEKWSPNVVVDFSNAIATQALLSYLVAHKIHPVVGTSGLSNQLVRWTIAACEDQDLGGVIAPNFSMGASLMMRFAEQAAQFYDFASILEMHSEGKVDAPSGTAVETARRMRGVREHDFEHNEPDREPLSGARGAQHGGISIHSDRMRGAVAHQQVVFGGDGELLTIRHDSTNRESFIPGVLLAIRSVRNLNHLVVGLDELLDL